MVAAAVAAGVLGTGAVVTPAVLAANDAPTAQRPGPRWDDPAGARGAGSGMGYGFRHGMHRDDGQHLHRGVGPAGGAHERCPVYPPSGRLTSEQKQRLADQAVREKLSHDVYVAFAKKTGDPRFEHIARSETRHLDAVRALMDRYDVTDPTRGPDEPGAMRDAYNAYVRDGSSSLHAALETAQQIEKEDIAALKKAAQGLDAPDAERVYEHLIHASEMHLAAFSR